MQRPIGTLSVGDRVTVTKRKGLWLEFVAPRCKKTGWALAEDGGVTYIRPVIPRVQYPWQRARGSGMDHTCHETCAVYTGMLQDLLLL